MENVQTFIATAGRVGVIGFGGYMAINHLCSIGDFFLFIALQDMAYGPISQLSIVLPKLERNISKAKKMFDILSQKATVVDREGALTLLGATSAVKFENVSFRYDGADHNTLTDVNLDVRSGSTVALIGASGSGKSTLVNLLQRLYEPQQGKILIGGRDIRDITQQSLRGRIAVVPQEVDLFARTIFENIAYGMQGVRKEQVIAAAKKAQAHEFIMRCEGQYDSPAGERGMKLSGGERQRIGLARAIMREPEILILDEATSHLDNESERLIKEAMDELKKDRTCFVIAHRLSTVEEADLVVVFNEGGIEAVGTHETWAQTSATYQKLHGMNSRKLHEVLAA